MATAEADLDDGNSLQWIRSVVQSELTWAQSSRQSFGAELLLGTTNYNFGKEIFGSESQDIYEASLSFPIRLPAWSRGGVYVAPTVSFAGEESVAFEDGSRYGVLAAAAWQFSPNLMIGLGGGVFSTLEGSDKDLDVFPFLVLDWKFADAWSIGTGSGYAASRGPGLRLAYQPNSALEFGLEARYEKFEYRLSDDHQLTGGLGSDSSIPVALTAKYTHNDYFTVSSFAGAALNGALEFNDKNGNEVYSESYETTPFFGLSASIKF